MTEHAKRERENERQKPTQRNLGQKEAREQARSDDEMVRISELTKEKDK